MTITIYSGFNNTYIFLHSKDERFTKKYGNMYRVEANSVYREFSAVASWVNNELGEECLFEMD